MKWIRIPDDDIFVRLDAIRVIVVEQTDSKEWRVRVTSDGQEDIVLLTFETYAEAMHYAEEFAQMLNDVAGTM
jgi:hypothetical protein